MRSFSRARSRERGFVLVSALVIAVLYLGVIEMLWLEAAQRMKEAQRFRARVEAQTLAENAAELAAQKLVLASSTSVSAELPEGTMTGSFTRHADGTFTLRGEGKGSRLLRYEARVIVQGRIDGADITIDRTSHWP